MFLLWFKSFKTLRPFSNEFIVQFLPLVAFLFFISGAQAVTLELKESVALSKGTLTVGDVAMVSGTGPVDLPAVSLGSTPLPGTASRLMRDAVEQVIAAKYPKEKVVWKNDVVVCRVERTARVLQEEEVQTRLEQELSGIVKGSGTAQVKEINSWSDIKVPDGELEFSFEIAPASMRSSWGAANMKISFKGEAVLARALRFRWSWMRPAWQAKVNLAAGQVLDLKDFEAVTIDVLSQQSQVYIGEELPADACLTRGLVAGRALSANDFKAQTLVRRGSPVVLRYQRGGLTIQLQVLALQDGTRGQVIAAQNTATRKKVLGRVADETTLDYVQ
jgi:flagella basal body P-ring formation protein FlgA